MYTDHMFRNEDGKKFLSNWTGSSFVSALSNLTWKAFQAVNRSLPEGEFPHRSGRPARCSRVISVPRLPLAFREQQIHCVQGAYRKFAMP